jgi:hypothetical protein
LECIGFAVFLVRGERDPTKGHGWGMHDCDASSYFHGVMDHGLRASNSA